jgi:serine/threonine-protein kinase
MLRVCEALAEIHASGAIHGSLSPAKIVIATDDDGSPELEFLGLLPRLADLPDDDDALSYRSPEQVRGEARVNARADLWALGAILHELLSGERAFSAPTRQELESAIQGQQPTPLRKLRSDIPPGMDTLVLYCLEKNPDGRPPSVGHVASALGRFVPADARAAVARVHAILRQHRPSDPRSDLAMVASRPSHDGSALTVPPLGNSIFAVRSFWTKRATLAVGGFAFVAVCSLVGHLLRRQPAPVTRAASSGVQVAANKAAPDDAIIEEDAIQVLRADELPATPIVDVSALPAKPQKSVEPAAAPARPVEAVPTEEADRAPAAQEATAPNVAPEAVELAEEEGASAGTGFDAAAAKAAIGAAAGRASACHDGTSPPEKSLVTITFASSGEASAVTVSGAIAGTPTGACVEQLFRGVTVPAFTGDSVTVSRTVSIGN